MTARCEEDLTDAEFVASMDVLEGLIVDFTRKVGGRLRLSETTQNACMKRALLTVLLDLIEHEPCDLARGEIVDELAEIWNRRTAAMAERNRPTAH
jgi:hypothetical protein